MQIQDLMNYDEDRFEKLEHSIEEYENVKNSIKTGIEDAEKIQKQKEKILKKFNATEEQWNDYRWQLNNRFETVDDIGDILDLSDDEKNKIKEVGDKFRYAISPYYMSVIDPDDPNCPVRKQAIPCYEEMDEAGDLDPMDEAGWSPVELITRRYPDRLIIKVTNMCGMYCRFCQRRRMIGEHDVNESREKIAKAIEYVREHKKIRDVLITGGDAFMLSDQTIDWLLSELRSIEHVEIIRFGTRTPVTLPQRITPELVSILKKYHPIFVNTHFNSQREITNESKAACEMLANAGIPLGNQMVLLNGVNNDPFVVRKLNQQLLKIRVKPYYIFHPKTVKGTSHFWVNMEEGMEIMESLRGRTSGMAIPTYIVNGSEGLGKTPIMPNYLLYMGKDKVIMRNWEGRPFQVENKK
ncbi:KamA family radical SAM protein [Alkalibacter mobilis]|uniref:KamA family radical SAM protein n=1 Tax=Alkalibacter mobilis TaxID=2787712 RepID=UPI00189F49F1|nr:KamA family radical SAM protein [Alkalibacter mobilis]MBF7097074.1 KamA family radical SAM protein [Alkalibacter mobilis]